MSSENPLFGISPEYKRQLEEAKAFILNQDRFLVVSHVNPDGDAIGSTLAVGHMLKLLGKSYIMMNEGQVPSKFHLLPEADKILSYDQLSSDDSASAPEFDCVIAVDCADYERIGRISQWVNTATPLLNIDHHPTNDRFGSVSLIRDDAAATAEVLYELGSTLNLTWNLETAVCIYTGLLTDTGGFRYSNTTPHVMNIASEMLRYGVNGSELAEELLERLTYSSVAMLQKALSSLTFTEDKRIAWVTIALADIEQAQANSGDLDGIVNYPRNIEGVEVGLFFKQSGLDTYKVSFRSAGKVDVAEIAQRFGGGGHVRASGCTMKGSLDIVVQTIVQEVRRALV